MSLPSMYGDLRRWALVEAESIAFMASLPDACIDAVVTDPPYGLGFGGASWDGGSGNRTLASGTGLLSFTTEWSRQVLRILKPGGHVLAFAAPRTAHRIAAGIEDAGFEIRDQLMWLFSSGMPKSRRLAGGRGTALKPAYEPIVLARKPFAHRAGRSLSTLGNLARFGTGTLEVDAARVPREASSEGYWPANFVLSHRTTCSSGTCHTNCAVRIVDDLHAGQDRLSRIFFASKASRTEREAGLENLTSRVEPVFSDHRGKSKPRRNLHPTVKPLSLMRWLVRLTVPPGGVVLDPFAGSGSTGCAVLEEGGGRQFVGLEREADYVRIARARLGHWATFERPCRKARPVPK